MSKRAIGIIFAGFFTLFTAFAIRYSYGLILPHMLTDLGILKFEAGIIFSSYFVSCTIFAPVFGLLADRTDTRIILSIFVAVLGIGAFLMSFSNSVLQASVFFAIAGIGHSACWAPIVTVLMRWVNEKRRGITLSIVDLGTTSGIALWSIIIPFIIGGFSWKAVWISLGITALVAALINYILIRSHPSAENDTANKADNHVSVVKTYAEILRKSQFYFIGFSYMFISFSILVPFTFLTVYATSDLMINYQSAAFLITIIAVSGAIGKLILGHLSDVFGRIKIMILCGFLTAVGNTGIAFADNFYMLVLFVVVFGVGYGSLWAVYAASARDRFSMHNSGSILGLWALFHGLGSVLSPVISGWIIDSTGSYFPAFILAVTASVISFILLLPVTILDQK
ncbi:MAG: MFS transporter [Spirochaetes bacterium]|nr:MFS transporter [Spirochaetota bacterium]